MIRQGHSAVAAALAAACLVAVPLASAATLKPGPGVTITDGPSGTVTSSSATFSFTSDDPSATFLCGLDNGGWGDCGSPQSYSGLSDGAHSFRVRAVDAGGKQGPPDQRQWTVQASAPPPPPPPPGEPAPETTISGGPPAATTSTSASISFGSNVAGSSFSCSLDGAGPQPCASPAAYSGLGLGVHSFAVRATSPGGTPDPTPAVISWTVVALSDTTPPDTAITDGPPGTVTTATAVFTFAASEPGATFACSLDGAGFAPCTSPATYGSLASGAHTFAVRASDPAGNADPTPATRSWAVVLETLSPPTPATPVPPAGSPATVDHVPPGDVQGVTATPGDRLITLRWRAPRDLDFAGVVVRRAEEGRAAVEIYRGDATSLADRRVRNGNSYRYELAAFDRAGNLAGGVQASAVPRSPLLTSPAAGARLVLPPRLVWAPVRGAGFYNVQLFRGNQKILSAWPRRARLQLTSAWRYRGKRYRLSPSEYRWYVWPGVGPRAKARYGPLIGDSRFLVQPRPPVTQP